MAEDRWTSVINVNLVAPERITRELLDQGLINKNGRVIGVSSIAGIAGNVGQTNYAASKAGMIGFSKALAQELASRNVTVNCVAPGFIASPMTDALNEQQKAGILSTIPAGKLGEGSDIAAACVFLASDQAGYVTGQTLHVNGGMAMI
jgi:3-oxoacyl-[acyl-carrier protein] reductase